MPKSTLKASKRSENSILIHEKIELNTKN
uniref:Uncharacterized protein n=1 Tax=Rhizophora mucronata TaxID=61149 RepID=A0A2P2IYW6_RHIMU